MLIPGPACVRRAVRRGYRGRTVPAQYDRPAYLCTRARSRRGVIRDPAASKWPAAFRRPVYGESTRCLFDPRGYQTPRVPCESASRSISVYPSTQRPIVKLTAGTFAGEEWR